MSESDLKPCPSCGSNNVLMFAESRKCFGPLHTKVCCLQCGCYLYIPWRDQTSVKRTRRERDRREAIERPHAAALWNGIMQGGER